MPYPINQSWREQIELNWIGARVGWWDTALKFLSPGPRNDVTDHLEESFRFWDENDYEYQIFSTGTLNKDDDDGSKNVDKKMNLRSFKLNRVYLDPLNMSNAGDFSWSWILKDFIQVQKEEGKFVVVCPRPP